MLIQTIVDGKNGYKQSISKYIKIPIKLTILPQEMKKHNIKSVDFQNAKFKEIENSSEKLIIANTGELQITWSLKNILEGQYDSYKVR